MASSALASVTFRRGRTGTSRSTTPHRASRPWPTSPQALWGPLAVALGGRGARRPRGEFAEAEALLAGGPRAAWASDSVIVDVLLHATGLLRLAQGRPAEALDRFEACGRRQSDWDVRNPGMVPWRAGAIRALLAADRRDEAATVAAEDLRLARAWGATRPLGIAERGAGLVTPGDDGIELLRASVVTLESSGAALEHALSLIDLGATLRRAAHRADARIPLREGLAIARGCHAHVLADRAHDELEASGAGQRRLTREGVETLTPSERRIAQMAAEGMANREIAGALFVTIRTVEAHLGHAYAKLGVAGRGDLPRVLGV